jgi:hypothetical protein
VRDRVTHSLHRLQPARDRPHSHSAAAWAWLLTLPRLRPPRLHINPPFAIPAIGHSASVEPATRGSNHECDCGKGEEANEAER